MFIIERNISLNSDARIGFLVVARTAAAADSIAGSLAAAGSMAVRWGKDGSASSVVIVGTRT
jgi:hypothetical protein